jgi:hypothetical protein
VRVCVVSVVVVGPDLQYPVDPDKATWPLIPGTKEPVLRFRWDESWEHDDNFCLIRMIIAHMKRHGTAFMPAVALALAVISSVKGSSPVRFFDQKLKDRNRNRSRTDPNVGGTEPDLLGPVFCG